MQKRIAGDHLLEQAIVEERRAWLHPGSWPGPNDSPSLTIARPKSLRAESSEIPSRVTDLRECQFVPHPHVNGSAQMFRQSAQARVEDPPGRLSLEAIAGRSRRAGDFPDGAIKVERGHEPSAPAVKRGVHEDRLEPGPKLTGRPPLEFGEIAPGVQDRFLNEVGRIRLSGAARPTTPSHNQPKVAPARLKGPPARRQVGSRGRKQRIVDAAQPDQIRCDLSMPSSSMSPVDRGSTVFGLSARGWPSATEPRCTTAAIGIRLIAQASRSSVLIQH